MTNATIGTCSNCGGPVQVPHVWYGVVPPTPTCAHCGAVARANHGPVIPMEPARKTITAPSTQIDPDVLKFWRGDGYRG
jgi:hypothetical protein